MQTVRYWPLCKASTHKVDEGRAWFVAVMIICRGDAVLKSPRESLRYPYIANALSPILAAYPHGER